VAEKSLISNIKRGMNLGEPQRNNGMGAPDNQISMIGHNVQS
jgi:hypothetical protein